jgi:hypothetical protein
MGNQYGIAGKSTREGAKKVRLFAIVVAIIFLLCVGIVAIFFYANQKTLGFIAGGVFIILFYIAARSAMKKLDIFFDKNKKVEKQYLRGTEGEEQVGELLKQLGDDFVVMNDVKSPYGNIDHVVYDRRGNIFMVETKSHGGSVKAWGDQLVLNGHAFEKDILGQCRKNAIWIRKKVEGRLHLNAWITAVLVFTNAFVEIGNPIKKVHYMNKKYLVSFLQKTDASSPAGLKLWEIREKEEFGRELGD